MIITVESISYILISRCFYCNFFNYRNLSLFKSAEKFAYICRDIYVGYM